jgi:hypothetical protein
MFLKIRGRGVLAVRFRNKVLNIYLCMFFCEFFVVEERSGGAQLTLT